MKLKRYVLQEGSTLKIYGHVTDEPIEAPIIIRNKENVGLELLNNVNMKTTHTMNLYNHTLLEIINGIDAEDTIEIENVEGTGLVIIKS